MNFLKPSWRRLWWQVPLAFGLAYLALLIPEPTPPAPPLLTPKPFLWNRDAYFFELEKQFLAAKAQGCGALAASLTHSLGEVQAQIDSLAATNLPADAPVFVALETNLFQLAARVAACPERLPDLLQAFARLRRTVKQQSEHWPMAEREPRERLYRLLYGGRAAVEEAMLQSPPEQLPALLAGDRESSATPSTTVRGVTLHSGDILLSRGNAATSAFIARGNDFPGNFSHVALVHVDETTHAVTTIESHIECGVIVNPIEKYLSDTKLRIMVLRLRADLPRLVTDPLLPHKAASAARETALRRHIPYDFAMDCNDHTEQFCSEVAAAAYEPFNVTLWMELSHLSTPGVVSWLSLLGVRHFDTPEPSDLEYDPQLRVVAEWRDPAALFQDHVDNAVIDTMLARAEAGGALGYNLWLLPVARVTKAWCTVKNRFGLVGSIPEGMSATTALRVKRLREQHAALKRLVFEKVEVFKQERGFTPPYWELVRMANTCRLLTD